MNKKIIIKTILILVIFSIVCSYIISQNTLHLDICENDDCSLCLIIHIAINIIKTTFVIQFEIIFMFLIIYILSKIHKIICKFFENTLLLQRVMFNE